MRPEILFPLFAPSSSLKGVGPKLAPTLELRRHHYFRRYRHSR